MHYNKSNGNGCCKNFFTWNDSFIFLLLSTGLTFSILSSMDCNLTRINLGFIPSNSKISNEKFGAGLWTFESYYNDNEGECFDYDFASSTSVITDDEYYKSFVLSPNDEFLVISRVMAMSGVFLAVFSCFIVIVSILRFIIDGAKPTKAMKILVLFFTCLSLLFELLKTISFLQITLCTDEIWATNNGNTSSNYKKAQGCTFGRGSWSSIISVLFYLIVTIIISFDLLFINNANNKQHSRSNNGGIAFI